jgi:hypothetical protein
VKNELSEKDRLYWLIGQLTVVMERHKENREAVEPVEERRAELIARVERLNAESWQAVVAKHDRAA